MELLGWISEPSIDVKRQIGVVPEGMGLFERLTGSGIPALCRRMYGLDGATTEKRTAELLDFMHWRIARKTLMSDLLHGMQKNGAGRAVFMAREFFSDEPFEAWTRWRRGAEACWANEPSAAGLFFLTSHVLEIVSGCAPRWPSFTRAVGGARADRWRSWGGDSRSGRRKETLEQIFPRSWGKAAVSRRGWRIDVDDLRQVQG